MKPLYLSAISIAIGLVFNASVMAEPMTKDAYKAEEARIAAEYDTAKSKCDSLSANAKDVCEVEAKGKAKVARAELEATYEPSDKNRYNAVIAKAEADFALANEKCDSKDGNAKDLCTKEAKAVETRIKADAEAKMKISEANKVANEKSSAADKQAQEAGTAARQDATTDKRDADYAVANEKCDALPSAEKAACVQAAKAKFNK